MTNDKQMREAFEREAEKTGRFIFTRDGNDDEKYWNPPTQNAWEGFQLAWQSHQAQGDAFKGMNEWSREVRNLRDQVADFVVGYEPNGMTALDQRERCIAMAAISDYLRQHPPAPVAVTGYKLVPLEPTIEMIAALSWNGDEDMAIGHGAITNDIVERYKAMLAATPTDKDHQQAALFRAHNGGED